MKSNAPGQLLGYACQFPHALLHLLKGSPGDVVCVEVLGDVATIGSDGKVIAEEDKSSTTGNPLSDRSTDLWKTFANWIDATNNGDLDVSKTKFVLFCNQSGKSGIVDKFSSAQDQTNAKRVIDDAKEELKDIKAGHGIWKDYDLVVNQNEPLLIKVVERFELQIGDGAGYDEVRAEVQRKLVPESQIEFLIDKLAGWLQREITEKIAARKPAIIKWEELNHQFMVCFDRARRMELIDFTLQQPLKEADIDQQVKIRPRYLRQLEKINASSDDILEAVIDFLRAKVNRDKWIEDELIDEDVASDFESRLRAFWKNKHEGIEITEKSLSEEERGRLLLAECRSRQEAIRDSTPPVSTIPGTYHALADKPVLGWHPNWNVLFPNPGTK